ncbi:MAG: hypothetical protein Q4F56_01565 [Candidatus Saccharibacteria bacterium]|nr:hypothetical protein [Candidatus Saccharibacteria bacterium]
MANKAKKDNKKTIIGGVCAAVVVVVVIIVAVVLANSGSRINDDYFVSDGTKYVLTLDSTEYEYDEEDAAYVPVKTHLVYTYSGDEITGLKTYAEYADEAAAKAAYQAMKDGGEDLTGVEIVGKYLVQTATEDQYEGMTASDVKQQIEFMESLKNMTFDEDETETEVLDDGDEVDDEEVIETEDYEEE